MRPTAVVVLAVALFALAACSTTYRTDYDYRPEHDFSGYKTWTWASPSTGESRYSWANSRIKLAVEDALADKGYQYVDTPAQADFSVRLKAETRTVKRRYYEHSPHYFHHGYHIGYGWHGGYYAYSGYWRHGYRRPYYYDPFYHRPYHYYPRREVVRVRTYQERTISLDIYDNSHRQPVWYGRSVEKLGDDYGEPPEAPLWLVMGELLEEFPPEQK